MIFAQKKKKEKYFSHFPTLSFIMKKYIMMKSEECGNNTMITYNTYILRQSWRYFPLIFKECK